MKIGLISTTMFPGVVKVMPPQIVPAFAGVERILHVGDIWGVECLDWLERIASVEAVEVSPSDVLDDPRVSLKRVVEVEGQAIGMTYDLVLPGTGFQVFPGSIAALFPAGLSVPGAVELLFGRPVDIVVSGHTNVPFVEEHEGIMFVNPGSPSFPNNTVRLGMVVILEVTRGHRAARIVNLSDFVQ